MVLQLLVLVEVEYRAFEVLNSFLELILSLLHLIQELGAFLIALLAPLLYQFEGVTWAPEDMPTPVHVLLVEAVAELIQDLVDFEALVHLHLVLLDLDGDVLHELLQVSELLYVLGGFAELVLHAQEVLEYLLC